MKKQIAIMALIIAICILSFLIFMPITRNNSKNGFNRKMIKYSIEIEAIFKLPNLTFDFAGNLQDKIILANFREPLKVFEIDYSLKELKYFMLKTPAGFDTVKTFVRWDILSPHTYITNSSGDVVVLNGNNAASYKMPLDLSDQSLFISPHSIVARSFEKNGIKTNLSLVKLNLSEKTAAINKYPFQKYADGLFGDDGWLKYDKVQQKLFYMYYYLGEVLCLDTNLNLAYKLKTIDTITKPKIKLGVLNERLKNGKSVKRITQVSTPNFVNRYFTTNGNRLYVLSVLKADNENASSFKMNQPIDVYSIKTGKYINSFYVPKYKGYKLRQFEINDDILIALFDTYLVKYKFKK